MERTGLGRGGAADQDVAHARGRERRTPSSTDKPGSELIQPYLDHLTAQIGDAILEARAALRPRPSSPTATAAARSRRTGTSGTPRRSASPAATTRTGPPTTRCSSRASPSDDRPSARDAVQLRLPPDDPRVGEPAPLARLHRRRARGAGAGLRRPALFFQGASGELAPRDDYVGDRPSPTATAASSATPRRRRSRRLPPPGTRFVYTGIVASGANLGTWEYRPCEPEQLAPSEPARGAC